MFQSMKDCTDFIFTLKASQYKGEPLESARKILASLGNPEKGTKFIHFAGSNGKGSTLNATREILMSHGLTVGAFISPHLERANERITINKNQISDEDFVRISNSIATVVQERLDGKFPSFFEFVTCIAFQYFAENDIDVALMETGIGGRLDSTNVLTPEVSVITTISLEHTEMLGDTYAKVASEKAGIIKNRKPVVIGVENVEARKVMRETAEKMNAPFYAYGEQIHIQNIDAKSQSFNYNGIGRIESLCLKMAGVHQMMNAALAITAAKLFLPTIQEETIRRALSQASWEGRFERLGDQVILDGAHNPEGTGALLNTLQQTEPAKKYKFIYAALQDKDHGTSIRLMDDVAEAMNFTSISLPRAASAESLAEHSNHTNKRANPNWQELISEQLANLQQNELLIITGSLYFIAEARQFLQEVKR
ncbi:bifunctional folylpolyglutamate synthase/dihydrofolate synthase [Lysinibacillus sp. 54212]|uniref:bifunctional folylpolyglutamate synthase/dihydrofolate synthase n=1 Tax=Lysinibacillus sp. 54212 TaxID=3119829 RepID=UPI002FC59C0E